MPPRRTLLPLVLAATTTPTRAPGRRPLCFCSTAGDGAGRVALGLAAALHLEAPRAFATPAQAVAALHAMPEALLLASRQQVARAPGLAEAVRLGELAHVLAVPARSAARHLFEFLDWLRWQAGPAGAVAAACPGAASLARALGARARAFPDADAAWRHCAGGGAAAAILHPAALAPELLAGRARGLATTSATRLALLSAIETFHENGLDALTCTEPLALHATADRAAEAARALAAPLAGARGVIAAVLRENAIEPARAGNGSPGC